MPDEPAVLPVEISGEGESEEMSEATNQITEQGNLVIATTAMANGLGGASALAAQEFGAAAGIRTRAYDLLANNASSMWTIAMTTPTQMAALGYRTAIESGSGRTRAETNLPSSTSAAGNATSGGQS